MPDLAGRETLEFRQSYGVHGMVGIHAGLRDRTSRKNKDCYEKQSHEL